VLEYKYREYAEIKLSERWETMFKFVIEKLDVMITESVETNKKNLPKITVEDQIKSMFTKILIPNFDQ
jgi:hypothetical protein